MLKLLFLRSTIFQKRGADIRVRKDQENEKKNFPQGDFCLCPAADCLSSAWRLPQQRCKLQRCRFFAVTYDGNGSTGGSVPSDSTVYATGDSVTVLGNTPDARWCTDDYIDYYDSAIAGTGTVSSGDEDGSDNWETLCAYIKDQSGTAPDISNFPAFNYAANYATYAGLSGIWASDWYLPSAYELYQVNKNYDKVKAALSAAGGDALATSAGDAVSYWTSSQMPEVSSGNSYYNTYKEEVLCVNVDNATEYSSYIDKNDESGCYYPRPIRSF